MQCNEQIQLVLNYKLIIFSTFTNTQKVFSGNSVSISVFKFLGPSVLVSDKFIVQFVYLFINVGSKESIQWRIVNQFLKYSISFTSTNNRRQVLKTNVSFDTLKYGDRKLKLLFRSNISSSFSQRERSTKCKLGDRNLFFLIPEDTPWVFTSSL